MQGIIRLPKIQFQTIGQKLKVTKMPPVQSIGYAAAYPAYPLNPPLVVVVVVVVVVGATFFKKAFQAGSGRNVALLFFK